jgi:amphi-Trp domain-containing protein
VLRGEDAAARLYAIADELASGNDIMLERGQARFVAKVPDEFALKIEFEVDDDMIASLSFWARAGCARPPSPGPWESAGSNDT